ncbi:thiol:disulfide interchange protein DsbA/DsbL [Pelomonas sp. APW6]|uniref:Thiol:disulfide interchange protein DsbA n=1 Tax=Roseateles subflavus TaxID=3053353 RepID=A0ABT7LE01_9BURK|nr:thiol:disulfide interchange protein DsbA/DsbL [Pelomonas sp. APW6]MDL5031088.1 thiol:disulfide interchange protein DsbA/DsbL [Pelomonas sp. APW6]
MSINRRDFTAAAAASAGLAALSLPPLAHAQGGPVEGRHYQKLQQPLSTTPGKVEVVEFFWYGCPHCYVFEPALSAFTQQLPADVVFRKSHVLFRPNMLVHQRTFFALEVMGKEAEVRAKIFDAIHRQGQRLDVLDAMAAFLAKQGVDAAKFKDTFGSMGISTKCGQADRLAEAFRIDGVPSIGIAGRYLTSPAMAAGGARIDEEQSGLRALAVMEILIKRARQGA